MAWTIPLLVVLLAYFAVAAKLDFSADRERPRFLQLSQQYINEYDYTLLHIFIHVALFYFYCGVI